MPIIGLDVVVALLWAVSRNEHLTAFELSVFTCLGFENKMLEEIFADNFTLEHLQFFQRTRRAGNVLCTPITNRNKFLKKQQRFKLVKQAAS